MLNNCVIMRTIAVFKVKRTSSESVNAVDLILSIDCHKLFFEMLVILTLIKFRRALISNLYKMIYLKPSKVFSKVDQWPFLASARATDQFVVS